jgi:hypothetical protein
MEALEVWAYTDRTPRSVQIGVDPSYGHSDQSGDYHLVLKAEMFCNFKDGSAVWEAITGNRPVTMSICKDMIGGRRVWYRKKREGQYSKTGVSECP